jgi:cytoskeletal protein CcmA (bactofilin family)
MEVDMWKRSTSAEQSRSQAPGPSPGSKPLVPERPPIAYIGKSVIIKGTVTGAEELIIDGQVDGRIEWHDQSLTIGPSAEIKAPVLAATITILGTVSGDVTASEKVDIRATGSVEGDIIAPRVVMADGALLRGRVDTPHGKPMAKAARRRPLPVAV